MERTSPIVGVTPSLAVTNGIYTILEETVYQNNCYKINKQKEILAFFTSTRKISQLLRITTKNSLQVFYNKNPTIFNF